MSKQYYRKLNTSSASKITVEEKTNNTNNIQSKERQPIFQVTLRTPSLKKHAEPSHQSEILGFLDTAGKYDIYNEINGWGQLKDNSWILLAATIR